MRLTIVNHLGGTAAAAHGSGSAGGYGLTGMGERLRLLNGTLTAGPCDGEWAVTAGLPLASLSMAADSVPGSIPASPASPASPGATG